MFSPDIRRPLIFKENWGGEGGGVGKGGMMMVMMMMMMRRRRNKGLQGDMIMVESHHTDCLYMCLCTCCKLVLLQMVWCSHTVLLHSYTHSIYGTFWSFYHHIQRTHIQSCTSYPGLPAIGLLLLFMKTRKNMNVYYMPKNYTIKR